MNNKGFVLIENLISLSIVLFITILVNNIIVNNLELIHIKEDKVKLLQITRSSLEKAKDEVKNSENYQNITTEVIDDYTIKKEIEDSEYYKKININVENKTDFLEIISYVYKR